MRLNKNITLKMNVFFDLECANCNMHIAKICEFGYVMTDDKLNIIKSDNLIIDPKSPFNVYGFKKGGITLSYEPRFYRQNPPLKDYYDRIKDILTNPKNRIFGYSTEYDAEYINSDFKRSKLPPIDFKFIDVMKLFRDYLGRSEKLSLDAIYSECENAEPLVHHEARNDSLMTVECFRHFLKVSGMSFSEAVNGCPLAYGELYNGRVVKDGTVFPYTKGNRMTTTNQNYLKQFVASRSVVSPVKGVEGKTFCFEKEYNKTHFAEVLYCADLITAAGGKLTNILAKTDYIIVPDKNKRVMKSKRQKILTIEDFCSILGVSPRHVDAKKIDVDYLISRIPDYTEWYEDYVGHVKSDRK